MTQRLSIIKKTVFCCLCISISLLQVQCSSDSAKKSRLPKQCDGKRKRPLNLEILAQLEKRKISEIEELTGNNNMDDVGLNQKEAKPTIEAIKKIPVTTFPSNAIVNVEGEKTALELVQISAEKVSKMPKSDEKERGKLDKVFSLEGFNAMGDKIKKIFKPEDEIKSNIAEIAIEEYKKNKQTQSLPSLPQQDTSIKSETIITKEGVKILDFTKASKTNENDVDRTKKNKGFLSIFGF